MLSNSSKNLDGDDLEDDDSDDRMVPVVLRSTAVVANAAELETWGTQQSEGFGALNFNPAVEDSEISDDPLRMYVL